jgi:hypothetical protein
MRLAFQKFKERWEKMAVLFIKQQYVSYSALIQAGIVVNQQSKKSTYLFVCDEVLECHILDHLSTEGRINMELFSSMKPANP